MPVYADSEGFYAVVKEVFERLRRESPGALQAMARARLVVRLKFTHPLAEVTLNGRRPEVSVTYGASRVLADFDAHLTGDALHQIATGQLSLAHALNTGQLKVIGPIYKIGALADLFAAVKQHYPQVIRDRGVI
jgi:hypothetical protein